MDSCQRSGPRQQLAAAGAVERCLSVRSVQGDEQSRAGLIGDRVKREQRLAHPPLQPSGQLLKRDRHPLGDDCPLFGHQLGQRKVTLLDPETPFAGCVLNCVPPAGEATRRPLHAGWWRQDEPVHLGLFENQIGERKQIRRPSQELVSD